MMGHSTPVASPMESARRLDVDNGVRTRYASTEDARCDVSNLEYHRSQAQ
jgi:hypothetical protein